MELPPHFRPEIPIGSLVALLIVVAGACETNSSTSNESSEARDEAAERKSTSPRSSAKESGAATVREQTDSSPPPASTEAADVATAPGNTDSSPARPSTEEADVATAQKKTDCSISIDTHEGTLKVAGSRLRDFALKSVQSVLGKSSRTKTVHSQERLEEFGGPNDPTSTMVDVTDRYYVYDDSSLVFHTQVGGVGGPGDPDQLVVYFDNERQFDHTSGMPVIPRRRGACDLAINGHQLPSKSDIVPESVDADTDNVDLFGATFAPTSHASQVDSLYLYRRRLTVRIFLDAAQTQRVASVRITVKSHRNSDE